MNDKVKYYIDSNGEFVIEDYNLSGPFSNFLPGIAGLFGIPMWAFYVNRAQCVCSFGVKSKDSPIMEFLPANRAYQLTPSQGFRTFIKIKDKKKDIFYEPFRYHPENRSLGIEQKMFISSHELRLLETAPRLGLEVGVTYFTLPNECFSALARIVTIKNISRKDLAMDVLDGTPLIIPHGVSNFFLKKMRRTVEAWMQVENLQNRAPFYRLKADPKDVSEVTFVNEGNFYLTSLDKAGKENTRLPIFVDPELIFGQVNDFSYPVHFLDGSSFKIVAPSKQIAQNKLPSAMSFASFRLKKSESVTFSSLIGHISSKDKLNSLIPRLTKKQFFIDKREENKHIIKEIQEPVFTVSNEGRCDLYCAQTFLDNVLRGGYPVSCEGSSTFYVYSRKHGDLERDYNRFYIDPTYFSQGNGNFRDINQNRRNNVLFNPDIKDSNILHFYNLLQADGYNPLVLHGVRFRLKENSNLKDILKGQIEERHIEKLKKILSGIFKPGELFMDMERQKIELKAGWHEFLGVILKNCELIYDAEHGEGFWIDHWTYNLDLIESFLSIYPEKFKELLFDKREFTFYDNAFYVKPRRERFLLTNDNVRQYHSVGYDIKKAQLIKKRKCDPHTVRIQNGRGNIYKTTLFVKLLSLTVNKLASLDPFGVGIEMDADKPGWCDSMNGLPGLLGSSTPEVFELKRQLVFMLDSIKNLESEEDNYKISLPEELHDFLNEIFSLSKHYLKSNSKKREIDFWDKSNSLKEKYRKSVRLGFMGREESFNLAGLKKMLESFLLKTDKAIKKAYIPSKKIYATYFINHVSKYEALHKLDPDKNLPLVRPTAFENERLPLFLEGIVRAMKVEDIKKARRLYKALKKTDLYDRKLKMYKINESLEGLSEEVGRSSIFTPGWLENESIWLHMEYKYLLEILRAGLYKEFFEEFRNVLIPFQKPEVYGRSIFEGSSFLVSSAFPDQKLHGKGFVARLSGSTAEMLSMWLLMNIGKTPFFLNEKDELNLRFKPFLPAWLFTKKARCGFPKDTYAFKFLGKIMVIYHNPRMKDTVGRDSVRTRFIIVRYSDGRKVEIKKDIIDWPYSQDIRDRKVERIDIYLG